MENAEEVIGAKQTMLRVCSLLLLAIACTINVTLLSSCATSEETTMTRSSTPMPRSRSWRDSECGFWIPSATPESLPSGYTIVSVSGEGLGDLNRLGFWIEHYEDLLRVRRSCFPFVGQLKLLVCGPVLESTEVCILCTVLYQMVAKEGWSFDAASMNLRGFSKRCGGHNQNAELYDEALRRLSKQYPDRKTVDIYIVREWATLDFY